MGAMTVPVQAHGPAIILGVAPSLREYLSEVNLLA